MACANTPKPPTPRFPPSPTASNLTSPSPGSVCLKPPDTQVAFSHQLRRRISPAWTFFALAALYAALEWLGVPWAALLLFVLVPLGVVLGFRLVRQVLRQSIWRLRNRLI